MQVSVVIPVRDAADFLPGCLDQLVRQDYPHEKLEVIIVDAMSRDATVQLAKSYPMGRITKQVLSCVSSGRAAGMNLGIRAAAGEAICRLDARTRISPDYISTCVNALLATGAANVGGRQVPHGSTAAQVGIGLAMSHPFGVGNAQFRIAKTSGYVDTVYLGFFRRDVFDQIGWYDERADLISEDSDMNQRICQAGEKIYLIASLQAYYEPRGSIREQASLYYRYGGARANNILKHRSMTSWRQLAAPGLVIAVFLLAVCSWWLPVARVLLLTLIGLYFFVDLLVSLNLALKARRPDALPFLLAAFPCMHWAYGIGFWHMVILPNRLNWLWRG